MGTTQIALDTTYHIWVEWTKGTGANGTMKLYVSTTEMARRHAALRHLTLTITRSDLPTP